MTWADNHRIISTTELWCSNAEGGTITVDTDRMNHCPDCGAEADVE